MFIALTTGDPRWFIYAQALMSTGAILAAIIDVSISVVLCLLLGKERRGISPATDATLLKIMRLSMETASLTSGTLLLARRCSIQADFFCM